MSKKKVIITVIVLAAVGLGVFGYTRVAGQKKEVTVSVMSESAKLDTIKTMVNAKGEVSLLDVESIYSNMVAEVEEVYVEKNQVVKKGDPLVRFKLKSKEKIEKQLKDAELSLKSSQLTVSSLRLPVTESDRENARLTVSNADKSIRDIQFSIEQFDIDIERQKEIIDDAKKKLDDTNLLFQSGAIPESEVETVENDLEVKENALTTLLSQNEQKKESLKNAEESLNYANIQLTEVLNKQSSDKTRNSIAEQEIMVEKNRLLVEELRKELADFNEIIYSPMDATVTKLDVSKGEVTQTEKVLMELADVENYVIKVDVNERNASKIKLGQDVEIEGPVLGKETVAGNITKIGNIADLKQTNNGTERVVPVEIELEKNGVSHLLKPGFSLEAVITTGVYENVVVVPILSTVPEQDGTAIVFVIKDDNTLEKRSVTLGAFSDMVVEVTGISEGEKIVAQPTMDMTDGMAVTLMNEEGQPEQGAEGDKGAEDTESSGDAE